MECQHEEALIVYMVEVIGQYFYPDRDEWGNHTDYNEIKGIEAIHCADCNAELEITDELRKKMGI